MTKNKKAFIIAYMKIFIKNDLSLDFVKYFYCVSNSIKVSNNFHSLNGVDDLFFNEITPTLSPRTLSIQGNIEADSLQQVEELKSEFFFNLYGQILKVYLDDNDERFYRCVLDGNVNISYNQGWAISKVFTISFSLLTVSPYTYEKKETKIIEAHDMNSGDIIYYKGNITTIPYIYFRFFEKTTLTTNDSEPFLTINNFKIYIQKDINIEKNELFIIKNGLPFIKGQCCYDCFSTDSLLNPLRLTKGENRIFINTMDIVDTLSYWPITSYKVFFEWEATYY